MVNPGACLSHYGYCSSMITSIHAPYIAPEHRKPLPSRPVRGVHTEVHASRPGTEVRSRAP